jgi:ATP-dependent Clp protease adaptor protein ClpS
MSDPTVKPRPEAPVRPKPARKTQRPPLYKVILLNDDFTPR